MSKNGYITTKGYHTLEDIATEVGLRKLGCTHSLESYDLDQAGHFCSHFGDGRERTKEEAIAAAFPFEVSSKTSNMLFRITDPYDFTGCGSMTMWQLTDPCLKVTHPKPHNQAALVNSWCPECQTTFNGEGYCPTCHPEGAALDKKQPEQRVEPECKCIGYGLRGHVPECPMIGWFKKKEDS